ncbi:glycosyl transferase [Pseudomonas sp. FFUP_PS_473]|uniref:glycosyltransferase n=1 Tax=Pseudomonas sp. FFUP_PS_473 TaxID=2060418 RepID=UPI000C7E50A8|nr:glycosyltransferase [Pseudomonas sp. FFUP_PS_473]PLP93193.1 glycosyl transferase [Pseudomonas sp. FFUP_PS_473]
MNAIATGSRSDVTVLLLGHEHADHRARTQHFYQQAAVPCLGLESLQASSTSALCSERLALALQQVTTPLVALALDADFLLPNALDNAAAHLQLPSQAIGAQGYALAYAAGDGQVAYHKVGAALAPLAGEGVPARLQQYAQAAQSAWRAVLRVPALQAALAALPADLDFAGWRLALSYALLAQGEIELLNQTDVLCEYAPCALPMASREERLTQAVRTMLQWDAAGPGLCTGEAGFALLNRFVRSTYAMLETPLLFTSSWKSVVDGPERVFEPRQFVELPYYNGALFDCLTTLEFLCHAWPAGQQQYHALEGGWVRQRDLLQIHPNDTPESLQERYWQALALGLFNREVCQRLAASFASDSDAAIVTEMNGWLQRLSQIPLLDPHQGLAATNSGQVLAELAAVTPDDVAREQVLAHLARSPAARIAFVVLDLANDDNALQATFDSLLASGLRNFKLLVLKAGKAPAITTPRDTLHFIQVTESNWVAHLNQAVRQLPSEWLLLMQAGEQVISGGLLHLSLELSSSPACQAICANEVQRDEQGRLQRVVRPGADLDLLRSQPALMSRHWVVRRQAVLDLGGYSEAQRQAIELDLLLRLVEAQGLASLAHLDDYLVHGEQAPEALITDARAVLERHLRELGYLGQVSDRDGSGLQVDFRHGATPLVSILVASEEGLAPLQACLTSVLQRTRYPRYEVVLACAAQNGASESAERQGLGNRVRLLTGEPGASHNDLLNLAASQARGEYLVLLSGRGEVITPAWLEGLLNEAQRPEVGVVGGALYGVDATLVHAGYGLLSGPQVHAPWLGTGNQWQLSVRGCAAVSGDCLMVSKALFEQCGGLQAQPGADIELCLRAQEAGLMVVWTPQAQVQAKCLSAPDADVAQALAERWPQAFCGRAYDVQSGPGAGLDWLAQVRTEPSI